MSNIIFESQFLSLAGEDYRVRLYGKTYIGLDTPIIGGLGNDFFIASDWRDYIQVGQSVFFNNSTLSEAYKTRVLADGGTFENENCLPAVFGESANIESFTYNEAENRTEIKLSIDFNGQTTMANFIQSPSSFIPKFKPVIIDLSTDYENSENYLLSPLMTSSTDVVYANVQEDRTKVDTAFFDRFIDLYLQSDDDELRITIERNVGGYRLEWAGNLVMDLIEWDNESSPRQYVFRAIDGIDRIKDVPYNGDFANLKNKKIKDIIIDVLALNGLDEFWADGEIYLRDTIEYQSVNVGGVNASDSPLDYSYIYENLLIEPDGEVGDAYEFRSGYDILSGLMELFSARLIHTNGYYYIQQIRNYDTNAITTRDYLKNGTYNATTYTHSNDQMTALSDGKFGYMHGIKRALMETERKFDLTMLPSSIYDTVYADFDPTSTGEMVLNPPINTNVGNIQGGLASNQYITLYAPIRTSRTNLVDMDFEIRLSVTDATNKRFLKGSDTVAPYWGSGNLVLADQYYSKTLSLKGGISPRTEYVTMTTPVIPYELENVNISVEIHILNIRKASASREQIFNIVGLLVQVPSGLSENKEKIYVDNPNVKFTKDLDLGNLIINETTSQVQLNNISVDANYNGGAVDYVVGGNWDANFDSNYGLTTSRVLEAMSIQYKPLKKYMGAFEGKYYPFQTIPYDNAVFAAKQLKIKYLSDEVDGEWFEVLTSRVGLSSNVIGQDDDRGNDDLGDTFTVPQNQSVGVGVLRGDLLPLMDITQILIDSTGDIKIGDKLQLVNEKGYVFLNLIAAQDLATAGNDVTLDVESFDLFVPIPSGTRLIYAYKGMYFSEKVRFDSLQHTEVRVAPNLVTDLLEGEIVFVGRDIYVKEAGAIYRHRAAPYLA